MYIKHRKAIIAGLLLLTAYCNSSFAADAEDIDAKIAEQTRILEELNNSKSKAETNRLNQRLDEIERALSSSTSSSAAIDSLTIQLNDLRQELAEQSRIQTEILQRLSILNDQQNAAAEVAREEQRSYSSYLGSSSAYLVNPSPRSEEVSYTQDAINSQGNSTMTFRYAPNQLYKIYCRPGYLTDLALRKGETIKFVGGGDTSGWAVNNTTVDGVPHLYIKPIVDGTPDTNIIITTDKHSYQLILCCSDWYNPMVRWTYDQEDADINLARKAKDERTVTGNMAVTNVEELDFNYTVSGDSENKPIMVFSDGEKTFIKFKNPRTKQVPIFIRARGKKELSLVNYKIKDNYYIIDKVFDFAQIKSSSNDETIEICHK